MALHIIAAFLCMLLAAGDCRAFTEKSWWSASEGSGRVIEFLSEELRPSCYRGCQAYAVAGLPDKIHISSLNREILTGLRQGKVNVGHPPKVYVLDLETGSFTAMELDPFLKLDILFEDFPIRRHEKHPEIPYGGNPVGHEYVAPIQRNGKEYIAALSSRRKTTHKTTFGIPGIIPFFGRSEWFQKEESHKGTFFLEVFDRENPSKPVVRMEKIFADLWLLPSVFEMAAWVQGAKEPILVVVDEENPIKENKGRVLVIRFR